MSAKPTPGPHTISQVGGGYEIRGIHGVAVGFFGRAWVSGRNGGHSIETPEAEANARAWVEGIAAMERLERMRKIVGAWINGEHGELCMAEVAKVIREDKP